MKDLTLPTPVLPPHEVMQKALDALAPRVSKQCSGRVEWRIMNKAEDAYCMVFTHDDYINPERAAREWMEQTTRERPGWIESNGYHAMPKLIFTESERLAIEAVELLRAALSHHEDGGRAATMVLVPREPTPEMIDALVHQKNLEGGDRWVCRNSSAVAIYKAAVNAFNEKEPRHG